MILFVKLQKLGQEQANRSDFENIFDKIMKGVNDALEKDRTDRRNMIKKLKEDVDRNLPKTIITNCRCDFLPNLPQYKNVHCKEKDCCRK